MDCILLLCFTSITATIRDDFAADQVQFSGQSIFACLPCEVFDFIGNMKTPNPLPQWLQNFHFRRAWLFPALFIIQESISGFDCIHPIRIEGPQQYIILNGLTERHVFLVVASKAKKVLSFASSFHTLYTGSIKSLTIVRPLPSTFGETIFGEALEGNQLSPQIYTDLPEPILHLAPRLITSRPFIRLFQAYEALAGTLASITDVLGKNLALKTL